MLKEIRLYGWLGDKYGRIHRYAVNNVHEAMRALSANFPTFAQDVIEYKPGYRVWTGTTRITEEEKVIFPVGEKEIIRISPAVTGADDDGIFGIILGAALIWATGPAGLSGLQSWGLAAGATGSTIGSFVLNVGISLVMGGIANLLAPTPEAPQPREEAANTPSYLFRGAVNTTAQGHPVPIGYGRLIIGSAVISAGMTTTDG